MARFTRALFVALVALAPTTALAGPIDDATTVVEKFVAAYNANDAQAIVKLYAPEAILLGTVSPVMSVGTDAIRAYFSQVPGSGNKVAIDERKMVMLSDGSVVATGFYTFTRIRDGNPVPDPARFTMVLEKRGSEWFIVHHHSSQRPKPRQ